MLVFINSGYIPDSPAKARDRARDGGRFCKPKIEQVALLSQ